VETWEAFESERSAMKHARYNKITHLRSEDWSSDYERYSQTISASVDGRNMTVRRGGYITNNGGYLEITPITTRYECELNALTQASDQKIH
jgi:hypothetical protein